MYEITLGPIILLFLIPFAIGAYLLVFSPGE